jgi:hypothetical protein
MTMKINLPLLAEICGALAGVAGSVLTPLYGQGLTTDVQGVLQALAALLVAIPVTHAGTIVVHAAKLKNAAKIAATTYAAKFETND